METEGYEESQNNRITLVYIDKAIKNNVLKQCASTLSVNSYYTLNS
jgi:hypothetical protein